MTKQQNIDRKVKDNKIREQELEITKLKQQLEDTRKILNSDNDNWLDTNKVYKLKGLDSLLQFKMMIFLSKTPSEEEIENSLRIFKQRGIGFINLPNLGVKKISEEEILNSFDKYKKY